MTPALSRAFPAGPRRPPCRALPARLLVPPRHLTAAWLPAPSPPAPCSHSMVGPHFTDRGYNAMEFKAVANMWVSKVRGGGGGAGGLSQVAPGWGRWRQGGAGGAGRAPCRRPPHSRARSTLLLRMGVSATACVCYSLLRPAHRPSPTVAAGEHLQTGRQADRPTRRPHRRLPC